MADLIFDERPIFQQSFTVQIKGVDAVRNNAVAWSRTQGAVTLEEACIRLVLTQVHNLSTRILKHMPWRVAQKIWRRIHPMTFEIWRMFVQVFGHEEDHPDASIVSRSAFPLPQGMETSNSWLTLLNLQVNLARYEDLVNLSSLTGLIVLILNGEPSMLANDNRVVDDRLVRTWSRSAQEAGAFSSLRVLSFHRCEYLSIQCVKFLSKIDTLAWSLFHNCRGMSSLTRQSRESLAMVRKDWSIVDLQDTEPDHQNRSILRLRKLPDLEHYAWLDWYKEETKHLMRFSPSSDRQPCLEDTNQAAKPILSFFCGRQPLALDYPLVFRRKESRNNVAQSPGLAPQRKRPSDSRATSKNVKRQMKDGKIQNTDFSQFYQ